jgi:hypothetical protein
MNYGAILEEEEVSSEITRDVGTKLSYLFRTQWAATGRPGHVRRETTSGWFEAIIGISGIRRLGSISRSGLTRIWLAGRTLRPYWGQLIDEIPHLWLDASDGYISKCALAGSKMSGWHMVSV